MKYLLLIVTLITATAAQAQNDFLYQSEKITFFSKYLGDSITVDVQLPQSYFEASEEVSFPLVVLFDQHNVNTYQYNMQTINIMSYHAQIPELIVVGIPFDESTRFFLTSHQKLKGDSLIGAQRLEGFVLDELLPYLEQVYLAKGPRLLIGHSRTAYFTSYLMTKRYLDFEAAASFSGFFEPLFDEPKVKDFLKEFAAKPKNFKYYFSAGTNLEEQTYLIPFKTLNQLLQSKQVHPGLSWHFREMANANHLGNYNMSLPWVLADYFSTYASTLEEWIYDKSQRYKGKQAFEAFSLDYFGRNALLGRPMLPGLVHIFSLANSYENAADFTAALDFYAYGASLYPKNMELQFHTARLQLGTGKLKEGIATAERAQKIAEEDLEKSEQEKAELKQAFQDLVDAVNK